MDRSRSNLRSVLIVLSDGKPFDERIGINSHRFTQEAPYEKDRAVEDTAREIRALRREGVAVLGVFTGLEEDLSAARRIYGQQFAYVKQVERFADTVALFLQEQLLS